MNSSAGRGHYNPRRQGDDVYETHSLFPARVGRIDRSIKWLRAFKLVLDRTEGKPKRQHDGEVVIRVEYSDEFEPDWNRIPGNDP
jgi:hypothetical protein